MRALVSIDSIRRAKETILGRVNHTPTVFSPGMSAHLGVPVALKLETQQIAGSFKPRGVANKVAALSEAEMAQGLIAVSGGNHGIAVATIAAKMGLPATIIMPEKAPQNAIRRIRAAGATLILTPDVATAFEIAQSDKYQALTFIHPFDDAAMLAGHGTLGLELMAEMPDLTDVLISIGGGGLIAGVAAAIKATHPHVRIWGAETVGADAMTQALAADKPIPIQVTSIASTLGAPYVSELTLAHVKALVEDVLVVSDKAAVEGILTLAEEAKQWVEPAAGCLVPAAKRVIERVGVDIKLGLVLCGGNISFRDVSGWVTQFRIER